ncbi:ribonuclease P protein component [Frondihabitans sucicola]|uniref:Ribonuclease P protein component n=1 Tax=Frondihabitans sucicola TaxID=1268041 RepID=A0ABM8GJX0_9MICO|nr:ribonuclease P protein component [Frondihabitans sucicola]BDZ48684.1 ribonuclease P protein component [Frondihabitans sucicola]
MLARANRIVRADDYRNTVRRGRKSATAHCVVYVRVVPARELPVRDFPGQSGSARAPEVRFGFIVAKTVGNAVVRNTVRRRLKAIAHEKLSVLPQGTDVVIRALPGSIEVPWSTLLEEITEVIDKGVPSSKV